MGRPPGHTAKIHAMPPNECQAENNLKRRHITKKVHTSSSVNTTELKIHSQNVQGLKNESNIEMIINIISQENLYAYCIQYTFLQGDFT
jgi:hypothetical protein